MKEGRSLEALGEELFRQSQSKKDFDVPIKTLRVADSGLLSLDQIGDFEMTSVATTQLAELAGVPAQYARRVRDSNPGLYAANLNHWLALSKDSLRKMVRTLDGKARAVLSDKYRRLDNWDLAATILPRMKAAGLRVESCEVTETRLYIKGVTEKVAYKAVGDVIQAGVAVGNSEVGCGSLWMDPLLFRLSCLNGAIMNGAGMRQTHIGGNGAKGDSEGAAEFFRNETLQAVDKAFWMKVGDTLDAIFNAADFEKMVFKFEAAHADKIEGDPIKTVELAQKEFGLTEAERIDVMKNLFSDADFSRHGLINAITATAQKVESYDRSVELEKLGGSIIEMAPSQWAQFAAAA